MKCKWCVNGYCEYWSSAEDQECRETQWTCDGTEEEMIDCGMA